MSISAKVGSILGKRQKSQDPSFGQPLDLGHIVLTDEDLIQAPALKTPNNVEPNSMPNPTNPSGNGEEKSSILDLDFMAAPLAEIELIQKTQTLDVENDSEASTEEIYTRNMVTSTDSVHSQASATSEPQPLASISTETLLATNPYSSPLNNSSIGTQTSPETRLDAAQCALAQSMHGDDEIGFIVFGPDGGCIDRSEAFARIIGLSPSEAETLTSYQAILDYMSDHVDLGAKDVQAYNRIESERMKTQIVKGELKTLQWTTTMKSGGILEFSNKYTPNNHLVTMVRDVSEKIEKSRLLRAAMRLGTSAYWSYCFKTGKSTLSEYMAQKLSPSELKKVETKGIMPLIHEDDAKRVQDAFDSAISAQSQMDSEFRLVLENNKTLFIRMIGEVELSLSSDEPEAFVAFLNDLTEDKRKTKELNEVKELSQNRSEFLARMSHEIKTPLNAIVGMTEALRDEVDNDEARETASFISDAAENLNNILSQTLKHEQLSTSEIILEEDVVNLTDVIKSSAAMWKQSCLDKNIKLNVRISPDLPGAITIDSSHLRQCLTNLISNAVKFTSEGQIVVAVAPMNMQSQNPRLMIAVRDTGIGMGPEAVATIFKPFQQGDSSIQRRFGGSGLGMSITQHIVKAMNGNIKVQSAPDEGTTIAITLPLVIGDAGKATSAEEAATEAAETKTDQPDASKQIQNPSIEEDIRKSQTEGLSAETFHPHPTATQSHLTQIDTSTSRSEIHKNVPIVPSAYSGFDVLIVEDNPINQAVVRKLLTNHIHSMDFAFHGVEALEILERKTFDVILMDIHMPVKDGIETTLEIRNSGKAWADTVIVALTADPDYQQKRVCRNIGMNDALSKPIKRQEILDVMQKVLNDRANQTDRKVS